MLKKIFTSSVFPFWFFHIPIFPYFLYLALKRGSLAFFTNTNPHWHTGGFVNSSKIETFKGIDPKWLPRFIYFPGYCTADEIEHECIKQQINYPLIFKPDKGERGLGVVKIEDKKDLEKALKTIPGDIIIQEYIDYPLEFGILYYKCPLTNKEDITSICYKEIPFVTGNGKDELFQLVEKKYKSIQFENLTEENKNWVVEKDKEFSLEYVAHRSRRCIFKNFNHLHSKELIATFQSITSKMEKFHFGRFDVKVKNIDCLINGIDLKILEVNGVNSQPIHIFDPSYSFVKCYRDLHSHWHLIYEISKQNSALGINPIKSKVLIKEIIKKYKK